MDRKPAGVGLKQILAIAGVVIGIGAIAWQVLRSDRVPIANRAMMVDVGSGQLYSMDVERKGLMVPERNPETGALSLMPVEQAEDGQWIIPGRMLGAISMIEGEHSAIVDKGRGTLRINDEPPRRFRPLSNTRD